MRQSFANFFSFLKDLRSRLAYSNCECDAFIRQGWARVALGKSPDQFDGEFAEDFVPIRGHPQNPTKYPHEKTEHSKSE
jgi:hypothetical protein